MALEVDILGMIIIVGLGNPGPKFKDTRHNVGFQAVDKFKEKNNFPDFKLSKKFNAEISEGLLNEEEVILAKPQTYMNESGGAIKKIIGYWKLDIGNLIVVHDDIDLETGKIKISAGRGSAGHKGIESIIRELGTNNFSRIRIGIEPEDKTKKALELVLKGFDKKEKEKIDYAINNAYLALETAAKKGLEKAMNDFNK